MEHADDDFERLSDPNKAQFRERREELIAGDSGFIGECREAVPFGEQFYLLVDGKEWMSCTHTPPHNHLVQ